MTRRILNLLLVVAGPLVLLVVWWLWTERMDSPYWPPPFPDIVQALTREWFTPDALDDLVPSLSRLLAGYVIAVTVGIAAGMVLGLSPLFAALADPVVQFFRAIPAPALVPFGILTLGVGDSMKIALIAVASLWPVLLNTIDGVRSVDPVLVDVARTNQIPVAARLRLFVLPSALPAIFAGMRTSLAIGLALMVISELIASTNGIGYTVLESQRTFAIAEMWAGLVILGIVGNVATLALAGVERRALRWHRGLRDREDV